MRNGEQDRTACLIRMITLIIGAVAAVLAIVAVTIYARRALKQALVVSYSYLYASERLRSLSPSPRPCLRSCPALVRVR